MKKNFLKIRKNVMDLASLVATKKYKDFTEDDLDILAESVDMLNDIYEELYDVVFEDTESALD